MVVDSNVQSDTLNITRLSIHPHIWSIENLFFKVTYIYLQIYNVYTYVHLNFLNCHFILGYFSYFDISLTDVKDYPTQSFANYSRLGYRLISKRYNLEIIMLYLYSYTKEFMHCYQVHVKVCFNLRNHAKV